MTPMDGVLIVFVFVLLVVTLTMILATLDRVPAIHDRIEREMPEDAWWKE